MVKPVCLFIMIFQWKNLFFNQKKVVIGENSQNNCFVKIVIFATNRILKQIDRSIDWFLCCLFLEVMKMFYRLFLLWNSRLIFFQSFYFRFFFCSSFSLFWWMLFKSVWKKQRILLCNEKFVLTDHDDDEMWQSLSPTNIHR